MAGSDRISDVLLFLLSFPVLSRRKDFELPAITIAQKVIIVG